MQVLQSDLAMVSRDYYLNKTDTRPIKAYEAMATALAVALGADKTLAQREIGKMLDFEVQLANVSMRIICNM